MTRILLALEDTPGAKELLRNARTFAQANDAELWVVHVLVPPESNEPSPDVLKELEDADQWLSMLLRNDPRSVQPLVVFGDPAHEIALSAKIVGADAIILGAHPRSEPRGRDATGARVPKLAACHIVRLAEFHPSPSEHGDREPATR